MGDGEGRISEEDFWSEATDVSGTATGPTISMSTCSLFPLSTAMLTVFGSLGPVEPTTFGRSS